MVNDGQLCRNKRRNINLLTGSQQERVVEHSGLLPFGWLNEVDIVAFLFTFRLALLYSPHSCPHHGRNTSAQCTFCSSNSLPPPHLFQYRRLSGYLVIYLAELHLNLTE